jgi:transcriptional regulator with XRE-family HTH domain
LEDFIQTAVWNARVQEAELFGRRLREIRKERGLTQEALAESADLSGKLHQRFGAGAESAEPHHRRAALAGPGVATPDLLVDFTCEAIKRLNYAIALDGAAAASPGISQRPLRNRLRQ